MTSENTKMSLAEFCQALVDEFAVALVMVKRSHPNVAVRSVSINIGQTEQDFTDPKENGETGSKLLLSDRYPGSEKGWQLQLELGERPVATFAGVERPLASRTAATVLDLIRDRPLTVIDGISTRWSRFFANFGITRLIHLARLEEPKLREIIAESNSLLVREFRQKVLLLKLPLPALPSSGLGDKSLHELLRLPMREVQENFSRPVTRSEVAAFFEVLDILNVVIDSRFLRKIPFHELLDG